MLLLLLLLGDSVGLCVLRGAIVCLHASEIEARGPSFSIESLATPGCAVLRDKGLGMGWLSLARLPTTLAGVLYVENTRYNLHSQVFVRIERLVRLLDTLREMSIGNTWGFGVDELDAQECVCCKVNNGVDFRFSLTCATSARLVISLYTCKT